MSDTAVQLAAGTGSSVVVDRCQVCGDAALETVLFLGYMPPVNQMRTIGDRPHEQPSYPAEVLRCPTCNLVQLGLIVDPCVLFPPEYPYRSGTTRILRENFADLYRESSALIGLTADDLIVDVGSNDGTLLRNFLDGGHRVRGIEPTDMGKLADSEGVPTTIAYFGRDIAQKTRAEHGAAKIVTAANVFAHIENVHAIVDAVVDLLDDDGVFISESHYLASLIETLQYDTVYHEHLRHYSVRSLSYLLRMHGLEVFHARKIPTHGGSIRVYAARTGTRAVQPSVAEIVAEEEANEPAGLASFSARVVNSKLALHALLRDIKAKGQRVYGIGAPSRASTLINYVGLDAGIVDAVMEVPGSYKIGKYMPGTLIPVEAETRLYTHPPDYALLLSWHIAEELMPKLREKGFAGGFIVPLPEPRIVNP